MAYLTQTHEQRSRSRSSPDLSALASTYIGPRNFLTAMHRRSPENLTQIFLVRICLLLLHILRPYHACDTGTRISSHTLVSRVSPSRTSHGGKFKAHMGCRYARACSVIMPRRPSPGPSEAARAREKRRRTHLKRNGGGPWRRTVCVQLASARDQAGVTRRAGEGIHVRPARAEFGEEAHVAAM